MSARYACNTEGLGRTVAPCSSEFRGVAQRDVESSCLFDQSDNDVPIERRSFNKFESSHHVLAAWPKPRLDVPQVLATPEAEEDTMILGTNEQDRAIGEIHQMTPLDRLGELRSCADDGGAERLHIPALPASQRHDIRAGRGSRNGFFHRHGSGLSEFADQRWTATVRGRG